MQPARDRLTADVIEAGILRLETEIKTRHPGVTRVFIEVQKVDDSDPDIAESDPAAQPS